jgi:pilus assembly protein CpaD
MSEELYGVETMTDTAKFRSSGRSSSKLASCRSGKLAGLTLAMAVALMSGCASYERDHITVGSVPDDYRTRHPIIVSENDQSTDIVIPRHTNSLPLRGRDLVRQMGFKFRGSGASSIAILIPAGSPNESAARHAANDAVKELQEVGIKTGQIVIKHYDASSHGTSATLRIVYTDLTASVASQCGDWNEDILDTAENQNYANFGCANQSNLAAMIANPADLLGPRGMSEIDSTKRTAVIEEWRTKDSNLSIERSE